VVYNKGEKCTVLLSSKEEKSSLDQRWDSFPDVQTDCNFLLKFKAKAKTK
jgi:hypothetical protein